MQSLGFPAISAVAALALATTIASLVVPVEAQITVLDNFSKASSSPNGASLAGVIAQGRDGNLYTTTPDFWSSNLGRVIRVTPAGSLTTLLVFNGTDGATAESGLTLGTDGNYYGATESGGPNSQGTLFKITSRGHITVLHNFTGGDDGGTPIAPPVEGLDGNYYGTTSMGGSVGNTGTIYRITPSGAFTTIHTFGFDEEAFGFPFGNPPLILGSDGNFYGVTCSGGPQDFGTVYRITDTGTYKTLINFDKTDGWCPDGPLVEGSDGDFYGATFEGGAGEGGTFYKISPSGEFTLLYTVGDADTNGCGPVGLTLATDGNFYGTTLDCGPNGGSQGFGTIFKMTANGDFSVIHDFDGPTGTNDSVPMVQHTNGKLYGDTEGGGTNGVGVFFSYDIGAAPFVAFLPSARIVANTVEIFGQGFTGSTAVSFNGTAASFQVMRDTYITAIVPEGAATGFITVTTPSGALTSNRKFQVRPKINSFKPSSGGPGTSVVIQGDSLNGTTKVKFGNGKSVSVTINSDKQLTAVVPSGATTGKIAVTTTGAASYSSTNFSVTR